MGDDLRDLLTISPHFSDSPEHCHIRNIDSGCLTIMPNRRAAEWISKEFADLRTESVDTVVSSLEAAEATEPGLIEEESVCQENRIEFFSFPIRDQGTLDSVDKFVDLV